MIVKSHYQAIATPCQRAWTAVKVQIVNSCVLDLAVALPTHRIRQRGYPCRAARKARHVVLDNLLGPSVHADFAAVEPDPARTEILHRRQIVRYKEHRAPSAPQA